eukprot:c18011_g1_i1 orf=1834-2322(-)
MQAIHYSRSHKDCYEKQCCSGQLALHCLILLRLVHTADCHLQNGGWEGMEMVLNAAAITTVLDHLGFCASYQLTVSTTEAKSRGRAIDLDDRPCVLLFQVSWAVRDIPHRRRMETRSGKEDINLIYQNMDGCLPCLHSAHCMDPRTHPLCSPPLLLVSILIC